MSAPGDNRVIDASRIQVLVALSLFSMVVLGLGLAFRQVVQGESFRELEQQQNRRRILMPGPRGEIRDRENRVLVANRPRYSAVVYLNELRPEFRREYVRLLNEAESAAGEERVDRARLSVQARAAVLQRYLDQINAITGIPSEVNRARLERHFRQQLLLPLPLVEDLDLISYARLVEQLPVGSPIQILTDGIRHYPYGSLASHSLGYLMGSEDTSDVQVGDQPDLVTFRLPGRRGAAGIEQAFDEHLKGRTGGEVWVVDPSGFQFDRLERVPPVKGNDLRLTVDARLQAIAERALHGMVGAAVAVDVQTGDVLAIASKPDYDLNWFTPFLSRAASARIAEAEAWVHRAAQGLYPPGSTFKLVTATAGLRTGRLAASATSRCTGSFRVGERTFHCHNRNGHGLVDLETAIEKSCNVYFYEHGLGIGAETIAAEAKAFGLDRPTGIELPNVTARMIVPDPAWKRSARRESWFPGDTANLSIGQGFLLTTPLHMAAFTASFARNEHLTRLSILHSVLPRPRGPSGGRALPPELFARVVAGMERAASPTGTGRFAAIPGLRVAAKTGTAQVFPKGQALTLAWTIAFAPAEDPRIAVAVVVEGTDPSDPAAGGTTAAPIARDLLKDWLLDRR